MASARKQAREQILARANRYRARGKPYTMRHIQLAVCVVRRQGVCTDRQLVTAGFNPHKK